MKIFRKKIGINFVRIEIEIEIGYELKYIVYFKIERGVIVE